jgi:hypothetical protein
MFILANYWLMRDEMVMDQYIPFQRKKVRSEGILEKNNKLRGNSHSGEITTHASHLSSMLHFTNII